MRSWFCQLAYMYVRPMGSRIVQHGTVLGLKNAPRAHVLAHIHAPDHNQPPTPHHPPHPPPPHSPHPSIPHIPHPPTNRKTLPPFPPNPKPLFS